MAGCLLSPVTGCKVGTSSLSAMSNIIRFKSQTAGKKLWHCNKLEFSRLKKGLLDTALFNHWTVWHSTVQPLDSWTLSWPAIGHLDTQLTSHWTVWHSTVRPLHCTVRHSADQPLDSWTLIWPAIGQLDTALADHWTVGHYTDQQFDSWTQHWPITGLLDTALSNHLRK